MPRPKSLVGYTDDELETLAKKYNTKSDFDKNEKGASQVARIRGDEFFKRITSHMDTLGSKHKRMVYAYFFPQNNAVYVGLTYNIEERNFQHISSEKHLTSVKKYIQQTGEVPKLIKLTDYIDVKDAQDKEEGLLNKFKNEGYVILNKTKTGGLGHGLQYSDEDIQKIAKQYNNIKDFYTNDLQAYKVARRRGKQFLNNITSHMKRNQITWDEDKVRELSKNFKGKSDFQSKYPGAANYAKSKGFWDNLFTEKEIPTDDEIINIGGEFETQNDFRINHPTLYTLAIKKNILPQIMFKNSKKKSITLTDDDIIIRAKQFTNLKDFYTKDNTAYRATKRKGRDFYNKVTSHFK
jgi:predicted GIY-YIG superfamily endonuclease